MDINSKLGKKKENETAGIPVEISVSCPSCDQTADEVFYLKDEKKVITKCVDHEAEVSMDLSWIYG